MFPGHLPGTHPSEHREKDHHYFSDIEANLSSTSLLSQLNGQRRNSGQPGLLMTR